MAADMDIEMDLDVGLREDDLTAPEMEILPEIEILPNEEASKINGTVPSDALDALEACPQKVHLRGLDNLTTKDVKAFASEYFSAGDIERLEWIDDTSANIVYATPEIAQEALVAFAAIEIADVSQIPVLQALPAKSFPLHPQTNLEVRLAVLGDRKQAGARDRSRFYLFNPEYDPAERRKRTGYKGGKNYRDRDDGGYRSRRYDDREQRKRQEGDENSGFDASLYDDDEAALAHRAGRKNDNRDATSSGSDSRDQRRQRVRFRGAPGKELFPDRLGREGNSGRLRDRSASPVRDVDGDDNMQESRVADERQRDTAASANRQQAQMIKSRLREAGSTKELFPHKIGVSHRRSDAFDAADETADLFANKMAVPLLDGSADLSLKKSISLESRITNDLNSNDQGGFSIRGAARGTAPQGLAIKGMASKSAVKELFPSLTSSNAGKELFSGRLEGRGGRRQKAEDLFY